MFVLFRAVLEGLYKQDYLSEYKMMALSSQVLCLLDKQESRGQSRDLCPNASGGLTPFSPPSELHEIPVATQGSQVIVIWACRS